MKNSISIFVNGVQHFASGEDAFMPLADFIRYKIHKRGTKIVCAEGDCGACTILTAKLDSVKPTYKSINSCIGFVFQYAGQSIITVEGLESKEGLSPVQDSMAKNHGAQCGYCTPGIVSSMTALMEDSITQRFEVTEKKVKNYLTGNLCRCTGYEPIIKAGIETDRSKYKLLSERYPLNIQKTESLKIISDDKELFIPKTLKEALVYKNENPDCRILSGATDLGVLSNKRRMKLIKILCLNQVEELFKISKENDSIQIGSCVSLDSIEAPLKKDFKEFSNLIHLFASPQIKNAGTLVGNIANGSPIGDTIPFMLVVDAVLNITSLSGKRSVNLNDFYLGYKTFDLKPDEIITSVSIPKSSDYFKMYKVSLRKDLDISAVTFAGRISVDNKKISKIKIALGGVGPTVLRMDTIEKELTGKDFEISHFKKSAIDIKSLLNPFSDVRGSSEFRKQLCHNLLLKFYKDSEASL
jgi:xanthine dehydrogenase small subunit